MDSKALARFMKKVDKTETCWLWTACKDEGGYGHFRLGNKMPPAHRVSFEHFKEPILQGLNVNHTCDNPPCVNPEHLWQGTQKEGIVDRDSKGRQMKGEKQCLAKLTEQQVLDIRTKYIPRVYTQIMLMKEYNIGKSTVKQIIQRRTWKHI
jgi:hypothetical protein